MNTHWLWLLPFLTVSMYANDNALLHFAPDTTSWQKTFTAVPGFSSIDSLVTNETGCAWVTGTDANNKPQVSFYNEKSWSIPAQFLGVTKILKIVPMFPNNTNEPCTAWLAAQTAAANTTTLIYLNGSNGEAPQTIKGTFLSMTASSGTAWLIVQDPIWGSFSAKTAPGYPDQWIDPINNFPTPIQFPDIAHQLAAEPNAAFLIGQSTSNAHFVILRSDFFGQFTMDVRYPPLTPYTSISTTDNGTIFITSGADLQHTSSEIFSNDNGDNWNDLPIPASGKIAISTANANALSCALYDDQQTIQCYTTDTKKVFIFPALSFKADQIALTHAGELWAYPTNVTNNVPMAYLNALDENTWHTTTFPDHAFVNSTFLQPLSTGGLVAYGQNPNTNAFETFFFDPVAATWNTQSIAGGTVDTNTGLIGARDQFWLPGSVSS